MAETFDAIVLGVGGMGASTCAELARRGRRVLGLEQFTLGHDRGSTHGQTRVIRQAYYEHPAYVPLARRAYERWYDLEQAVGQHLLTTCGVLSIGPPECNLIRGVRLAATEHDLPIELLNANELRQRFPQFRFDESNVGVLERNAGFLAVDACVRAHIAEARRLGAELRENEPARAWQSDGRSVRVVTDRDTYHAARLVITAGPWAGEMLARHEATLTVMRQVMLWFGTADDRRFRRDVFPAFIADTPTGHFYGLPMIDGTGQKTARHYGAAEFRSPAEIDRATSPADEVAVREFLDRHIPEVNGPCRRASVCVYTLTPDRHFVIDRLPNAENVAVAAGFSGHGYKFASVVGEILADLSDEGRTALPVELFRLGRFAGAERL